jgi:hypothetical protein
VNQFYVPPSGGKTTELIAGDQIGITDLSDSLVDRFEIDYLPIVAFTAALTLVAKASSIVKANPVLLGTVIDRIELTWTYNHAVASQTITNDGALTPPTLIASDRGYDYTSQSIVNNTEFTLDGNDGLDNGGQSAAEDSKSITFGNYLAWGKGASLLGLTTSDVQTRFAALADREVRTDFLRSVYATGTDNEKFFVMYPKRWGLADFKKGIFVGGLMRVKKVVGQTALKVDLEGGEVEEDIIIANGSGHSEAYYIYETLFDNQEDAVTPIQIING